jgi:polyphosphate kinase 2 (PPK2 family)
VNQVQNPENISVDGETISLQDFITQHKDLVEENASLRKSNKKAIRRYQREEELKPFQAELLQVQRYLEEKQRRMIILFEGRDAAGKGGTIRRVTRYMNEKHYRIVALGKPTEEQKTQWYYQKYVSQFPRAGEIVLSEVSPITDHRGGEAYRRAMARTLAERLLRRLRSADRRSR